jgi:hypothetical protein
MGNKPDARPLPTQDSTTQTDRDNSHAVSGIRTHDLSDQAIKAYASDRTATRTGCIATALDEY